MTFAWSQAPFDLGQVHAGRSKRWPSASNRCRTDAIGGMPRRKAISTVESRT